MLPTTSGRPANWLATTASYAWPLGLNGLLLPFLLLAISLPALADIWVLGFLMASSSLNCVGILLMLVCGKAMVASWFGITLVAALALGALVAWLLPAHGPV